MALQFHPLVFGVMVIVAIGTVAYSVWNASKDQHPGYTNPGRRRRSNRSRADDFFHSDNRSSTKSPVKNGRSSKIKVNNTDDCSSTKSSIIDIKEHGNKTRNSDKCVICHDLLNESRKTLTCGHNNFHENCITRWLGIENTCPMCRAKSGPV